MKNKLYGNLVLCKEFDDNLNCIELPFDHIQIDAEKKIARFELMIFLNCLPHTKENVDLIITLSPESKEAFRIIGFRPITLQKDENFIEVTTLSSDDIDFKKEGVYHVDLRSSNINISRDSSRNNLREIFEKSEIINRASFLVEFKK